MARPWSTAEVRRALELRRMGFTLAEAARALGRSESRLREHLAGRDPLARPAPRPVPEAELRALAANGLTPSQMARELSLPLTTVWNRLRALGVPYSRQRAPAPPPSGEAREACGAAQSGRNRDICGALGWPEVVVPAHARVLAALAALGPLDHASLALALGWALRVGPRGGLRSQALANRLGELTRPFDVDKEGAPDGKLRREERQRRYVEVIPGRPRRYAVAAWLMARRGGDE